MPQVATLHVVTKPKKGRTIIDASVNFDSTINVGSRMTSAMRKSTVIKTNTEFISMKGALDQALSPTSSKVKRL